MYICTLFTNLVLFIVVALLIILKCMIIFRKDIKKKINGPQNEKFPDDEKIYDKNIHNEEHETDKPPSPKSHFNKVYKHGEVHYHETAA